MNIDIRESIIKNFEESDIEEIYSQADVVIQNADKIQNYIRLLWLIFCNKLTQLTVCE